MMRFDPARERALRASALTPEQIRAGLPAGFFEGIPTAIVAGVGAGALQTSGLLYGAAGSLVRGYNQVLTWQDDLARLAGLPESGQISTEWLDAQRDKALNLAQSYKPDPMRTGMAGQILFDLSRVMTQVGVGAVAAVATGGAGATALLTGAAVTGASTTYGKFAELKKSGVDDKTALQVAAIEGLVTGGGVVVPAALGYNALTKAGVTGVKSYLSANVLYGAGANIGMGVTERAVVYDLLHENYPAMAKHYQPLEASALIAEGALGAIFGAVGARAGLKHRALEVTDAALTARAAKHAALDTAPGIPADPSTAAAHARASHTAMEQLLNGDAVDVSGSRITEGNFVSMPRDGSLLDAAREYYGVEAEPRPEAGTPEAIVQSQGFRNWYGERSIDQLEADYQALPDTHGGRIIDADRVRELAPDYVANRARSAELHPYASALTKVLFARALARPVAEGRAPVVAFLAGGGGSGKSTAGGPAIKALNADIVMDGTFSKLESARASIEAALASNRKVEVVYVYRSPEKSARGAVERAIAEGRPVPVEALAEAHAGASQTVKVLAREYNGNDGVRIFSIWNDGEFGTDRPLLIEDIPHVDKSQAENIFRAAVDAERQAGRIGDELYNGFVPARSSGAQNRGGTEQNRSQQSAPDPLTAARAGDDLETRAGLKLLEEKGDLTVPVELDTGEIAQVSLQDALREADAELGYANKNTFDAAVQCGLSRGL